MNRKTAFILSLPFIILLICWSIVSANHPGVDSRMIQRVTHMIEKNYVKEVDSDRLTVGAIDGMLSSLDPYSVYLDKEGIQNLENTALGRFGGLGLEVTIKNGFLSVITPVPGSPAEAAGIQPQDTILKIDDWSTKDATLRTAIQHMKGEPGTKVDLRVMREGQKELMDFTVTREIITIKSVKEFRLLEPGVGYVKLVAFQEHTAADLDAALGELKKQGAAGLILDLRNNSGGLLSAAIQSAELILPRDALIVSTEGKNSPTVRYYSGNEHPYDFSPIVAVVNRGSASGSEILAAVIQDHRLGSVVGTQTFGKGSIQKVLPLAEDRAVRITTSYYRTPGGRLLQDVGLKPDVEVNSEPLQLERALELAKKHE